MPRQARLPVSFDQRRHVGGGDRAGSWMALSFRLPWSPDLTHLEAAWRAVIARHGTLRSVFIAGPDGEPQLHAIEPGEGRWVEHPIASGQAVNDALREVLDAACTPYAQPSHRLCVLETADGPTVVVAADHSHVDMWSMLVIARDLLAALDAARAGRRAVRRVRTRAGLRRPHRRAATATTRSGGGTSAVARRSSRPPAA